MVKLSDLGNPKNGWILMREKAVMDQFLGLLVEMNASAKSIAYRYELLQLGEIDGPQRYFGFDKEQNMQKHALNGIGAALIIGTDLLIKEIRSSAGTAKSIQVETRIPKIKSIKWEHAIRAAGNYVRHSDEWQTLFEKFCENKKILKFSLEERPELISEFLDLLQKTHPRPYENIKILKDLGFKIEAHILVSDRIWDSAKLIFLNDVEGSMNMMRKFVDSFHDRSRAKKKQIPL